MEAQQSSIMVPETFEGWAVLHEMFQIDWSAWRRWSAAEKETGLAEAIQFLKKNSTPSEGESACFSLLGHKGDLLFIHFRRTLEDLNNAELALRQIRFWDLLKPTTSYLSFVELGMYEMTVKLAEQLTAEGLKPDSEAWAEKWKSAMKEQGERIKGRTFTAIPKDRYLCFYPMDKKRGEQKNWYALSMAERQRMMRDHGMIGRKYGGQVTQVISGSIGHDDWEWGVDLFANDPIVFKKLIYEMRFDEASAHYALFGPFYNGIRFEPEGLRELMNGKFPNA